MSTATLEKPEKTAAPVYTMPRPAVGGRVSWFPRGDQRTPHEAIVKAVYADKIECMDTTDHSTKVCFHAGHPTANSDDANDRLIINLVDGGTWDFSKEDAEKKRFVDTTNARLAALEAFVADMKGEKKK